MAEKTLILKVDLSCAPCRKKMDKIFIKYQDKWNIKKITWDDKNDKITLAGPFDPEKLKKKLCCKACRTIKEFIIPEPPKPAPAKPEPPKPTPEPPKPAPEPPKPAPEPPKPAPEPPKPAPEPPKPAPPPPKPAPPPPTPACPQTLWFTGQICTCGTCHEKQRPCPCGPCHEERRPCSCGCGNWCYGGYSYGYGYPPPPTYGRPACQIICEEDPSGTCSIM